MDADGHHRSSCLAPLFPVKGLVMLPWILRNVSVYGTFVMHVPVSGNILYFGSYPHPPMYGRFWHKADGELVNLTTTKEYQDIVGPFRTKNPFANKDPGRWNEVVVDTESMLLDVDRGLAEHALSNIRTYPETQLRNMAYHFYDLWKRPAGWEYTKWRA